MCLRCRARHVTLPHACLSACAYAVAQISTRSGCKWHPRTSAGLASVGRRGGSEHGCICAHTQVTRRTKHPCMDAYMCVHVRVASLHACIACACACCLHLQGARAYASHLPSWLPWPRGEAEFLLLLLRCMTFERWRWLSFLWEITRKLFTASSIALFPASRMPSDAIDACVTYL